MIYNIVTVLWQDHLQVHRDQLPENPDDELLSPTLSIGAIVKEGEKSILLVSDFERYKDRDEASYLIILKPDIIATKEYGQIEIDNLRFAP